MKLEQISEHVWSLKTWFPMPIHVWLVSDEEGVTLVDAGMPRMAKGIMKTVVQLNKGPLKQILLTHGHSDHTGAVSAILKELNVPVYAHQIEIPYMEGERMYPKRKKFEVNLPKNVTKPLMEDEKEVLSSIAGLTPYLTPGHSPGHVVYYHEQDRVLLAGDLFMSKKGKLCPPMKLFTADMDQAVNSASILTELSPMRIEVCHGNPVSYTAAQLEEYLRNTAVSTLSEKEYFLI